MATAENLKIGIIGTGRAGQCHAAGYSRLPGVQVTALWNRSRDRAEEFAATFNSPELKVYDDWRKLLDRGNIDIVSITTDPIVRLEPFVHALQNRIHVLVEKPLALNLSDAATMHAVAEKSAVVSAISFNWRYSQACRTMWQAIQAGRIGLPHNIRTEWRLRFNPGSKPLTAGRGLLTEMGSHEFDRACLLTGGRFIRVVCDMRSDSHNETDHKPGQPAPPETFVSIMSEMTDQIRAGFLFGLTPGEPERRVVVSGDNGTLILKNEWVTLHRDGDMNNPITLGNELQVSGQYAGDSGPVQLPAADSDLQPGDITSGQHTWNRLISDFVSAVREHNKKHLVVSNLPQLTDGLKVQRVIDACEQSHNEQHWVDVV